MSDKYAALKHAAERATPGPWRTSYIPPYGSHYVTSPGGKTVVNISEGDVPARDAGFIAAANPAIILELLAERDADRARIAELGEALEKASRANSAQDDHINQQQDRIDELEKVHQEAARQINAWHRLAKQNISEREKDLSELDSARQRVAELEAQASTHDRLCDSNYIAGMKAGWNLGIANDNAGFNQCLSARVRRWPDDDISLKIEGE